jgi:hypothetical protein
LWSLDLAELGGWILGGNLDWKLDWVLDCGVIELWLEIWGLGVGGWGFELGFALDSGVRGLGWRLGTVRKMGLGTGNWSGGWSLGIEG